MKGNFKVAGPQLEGPYLTSENLKISWRASTDCSAPAKPQKRHTGLLSCRGCLRNETRTIIITSRERVALRCRFYWRGSRRWRGIVRTFQVSAGDNRRTIFRAKIIAFRIRKSPNDSLGRKYSIRKKHDAFTIVRPKKCSLDFVSFYYLLDWRGDTNAMWHEFMSRKVTIH